MGRKNKIKLSCPVLFLGKKKMSRCLMSANKIWENNFILFFSSLTIAPELNDLVLCTPQRSWCCSKEGL
jgi:hypothetical protein